MGHLTGKTAIITGGGRAVLTDGTCGSIGYGIATAYAKEGIRGLSRVAATEWGPDGINVNVVCLLPLTSNT